WGEMFLGRAGWVARILCATGACDCVGLLCVDGVEVDAAGVWAKAAVLRPKAATVASASTSLCMISSWGDQEANGCYLLRHSSNRFGGSILITIFPCT